MRKRLISRGLKRVPKVKKPLTTWFLVSNRPTDGGMALIRALGGKRIRMEGTRFTYTPRKKVINWGNSDLGERRWPVLNRPSSVGMAANKLQFFNHISRSEARDDLVPFTTEKRQVQAWVRDGYKVVQRNVLNGHSGQGITIVGGKNEVGDAPLYTLYIPKDEEWRIHLIADLKTGGLPQVIYVQKKVKRADFDGKHNRYIRNHENGYTYQHNNVEAPAVVIEAATRVFEASGLDFGAVDVIFCRAANKAFVLEINTAPGLEGHSLEVYRDAFIKYF